ncbi:MAG: hypothetical protein ABJN42_19895 [Roseibium sp.]|uniref:hypothetical protein n=1 Tax=Roseibium sp. TaxID=1936156 RepID=UPI003297DF1C
MFTFDLFAPMNNWLPTLLYPGFRPGMPDIVLGKLPDELAVMSGKTYKSWILENPKESELLKARLAEPLPIRPDGRLDFIAGPDSAVRKKGQGMSRTDSVIAIYSPPEEGWPLIVMASVPFEHPELERSKYAWETFDTDEAAVAHAQELIQAMGNEVQVEHGADFRWN